MWCNGVWFDVVHCEVFQFSEGRKCGGRVDQLVV